MKLHSTLFIVCSVSSSSSSTDVAGRNPINDTSWSLLVSNLFDLGSFPSNIYGISSRAKSISKKKLFTATASNDQQQTMRGRKGPLKTGSTCHLHLFKLGHVPIKHRTQSISPLPYTDARSIHRLPSTGPAPAAAAATMESTADLVNPRVRRGVGDHTRRPTDPLTAVSDAQPYAIPGTESIDACSSLPYTSLHPAVGTGRRRPAAIPVPTRHR
jgi:hypothetical protein